MSDMYFTRVPGSASRPEECNVEWRGERLRFVTDAGVFSRGEADRGSIILLDALPPLTGDVLDLGCGWGLLGVALGRVNPGIRLTMVDVNTRALGLAEENARANGVPARVLESDGFSALGEERFDAVITNPPIRAGKQVIYGLFDAAADHLKPGGALYLVIRKQQGAESCEKHLRGRFGDVRRLCREAGFWVLRASGAPEDAGQPEP